MTKFKVGDYVETDWGTAGVERGEQGIVIDDKYQDHIQLMFPARADIWSTEAGWMVAARHLKLLYRPRSLRKAS